MIELLGSPEAWVALITLTALEVVLGIDNVVFIAILTARLPAHEQPLAYRLGLGGAMVTRIALLLAISWVVKLNTPLFEVLGKELSGRDLIMIGGGVFLIGKSAQEVYDKVEGEAESQKPLGTSSLAMTVVQIALLDIVFSLDSVITAVGMVDHVEVMITAIVLAIVVMLVFATRVGNFVNENPSIKILALSFLLLIGVFLTAEGFGQHISKGYIYFAMGFSLLIELVNMRRRKNVMRKAVE